MESIPITYYGLSGLVISTLVFVVRRQYFDNRALQAKYDALQEARRLDAVEVTNKVVPVMSTFSETANLLYTKLRASKETS